MKEIEITEIENVYIGQTENRTAGTGVTVLVSPNGMAAGLDVQGGGPASRESELLKPMAYAQTIHAVVLGGGSAFGLDAAGGVMQYLEKQNIGIPVGKVHVPLVCQSDIFDLGCGAADIRPDQKMGYQAARLALESPNYQDGNYGAGCGATVGKVCGMSTCMKTGIGSYAVQLGELKIGAVVVVNAVGDVFDWRNGRKVAGLLSDDHASFRSTEEILYRTPDLMTASDFTANTTIGCIITNAQFDKSRLCKIAGMAHDGYARSIRPVHTTMDGDSIYALSVGDILAEQDIVGSLGAEVMSQAILRAVYSAESAYGFCAARDLVF